MTKQERINELENELAAQRRYIHDLRERHTVLVNELSELACGVGTPAAWHHAGTDHVQKMEYKASRALARVAKMALREGP